MLPPDAADRLAKLIGLLGSEHAGERAAAGAKATELLTSYGLSWPDVTTALQESAEQAEAKRKAEAERQEQEARRRAEQEVRRAAYERELAERARRIPDENDTWQEIRDWVAKRSHALNDWERKFISDLNNRRRQRRLSAKQFSCLMRARAKAMKA